MIIALLDLDVLRYTVGFACEYTNYHIDNNGEQLVLRGKKRAKKFVEENPGTSIDNYVVILEPVEYCLHSCKRQLEKILKRCKTTKYHGFLSGTGNFRDDIATIKPYKGNRPDRKPAHYDALTEYLINYWNAKVIDGMEADDALAINQTKDTCIASIDKDLLQVPGKHYDFYHDKRLTITRSEAIKRLYGQIIAGDSTDNIGGVPGIGIKGAYKLLELAPFSERGYYGVAKEAYYKAVEKNEMCFGGLGPDEALVENARLVYLLRSPSDEWNPPN